MRSVFIALCLLLVATAPSAAETAWSDVAGAAGVFDGWAKSGGGLVPVETRLVTGPDGVISGTYRFEQANQIFHGTLSHGRATGPADLTFIWHDDWGWGLLILHFDARFRQFTGAWGPLDDSAMFLPWVGMRVEPADQ